MLTQAAWADQSCHIEPLKMAENFFWWIHFGVGSCGRQNVIVANTVVGANIYLSLI